MRCTLHAHRRIIFQESTITSVVCTLCTAQVPTKHSPQSWFSPTPCLRMKLPRDVRRSLASGCLKSPVALSTIPGNEWLPLMQFIIKIILGWVCPFSGFNQGFYFFGQRGNSCLFRWRVWPGCCFLWYRVPWDWWEGVVDINHMTRPQSVLTLTLRFGRTHRGQIRHSRPM